MARSATTAADRVGIASRAVAALVGGYAFATVAGVFLSRVLPMARADAVLAATLASFGIFAAAVIWVFAARSAMRAWLGLLIPIAVLGAAASLIGSGA